MGAAVDDRRRVDSGHDARPASAAEALHRRPVDLHARRRVRFQTVCFLLGGIIDCLFISLPTVHQADSLTRVLKEIFFSFSRSYSKKPPYAGVYSPGLNDDLHK